VSDNELTDDAYESEIDKYKRIHKRHQRELENIEIKNLPFYQEDENK
jgi:hypothetical protein